MSTIRDYIHQTISNTPGVAGNLTLSTAVAGMLALVVGDNGLTFEIEITETGLGSESRRGCVYTHGTLTMTRGTLVKSTTGAAINFTSAATMRVVATEDWGNSVDVIRAASAAGTSGGVLGFTAAGVPASSAALAAGELVRGGGAGAVPSTSGAATVTAGTVTTAISPISITETRNAAGVTFPGVVYNVTETASAAGSNLLDLKVGGTSQFQVHKTGAVVITGNGTTWGFDADNASASWLLFGRGWTGSAFSNPEFGVNWSDQIVLKAAMQFAWSSAGGPTNTPDLFLTRAGAASLRLGAPDAASPVAQTLRTQGPRGGTDSNTAGVTWTLYAGPSTGNATPATIRFQSTNVGASGTAAQTLVDTLIISNGCTRGRAVTVATLPASPTQGDEIYVTDALAPTWNTALVGGGAVFCGARWNGAAWVAF